MAGSSTGGSLIGEAKLKQLYATMLQCRLLTEYACTLRGRYRAPYSASLGQEAIATACAIDLRPQDTIVLAPNNSIAGLVKGVSLSDLVAELYAGGRYAGSTKHNVIGPATRTAPQLQLANNVALDNQQKRNTNVVVAFNGMASTTLRGWHQALKVAARLSLPIIVVVENNPWSLSDSRNGRVDLSRKAQTEGLTSIIVDGNDVVAVYRVAYESLERVRQGGGPVLVEAKTYRLHGQTLPRGERDPLLHMERYLRAKNLFTARWRNQLVQRFSRELDAATRKLPAQPTRYLRASQPAAND